ncbi:hypothetical protein DEEACLCL_00097 [Salmonella phage CRW-SP2]|nr:hypothetical protein DEEACLCL_00097 [Salmonella phage CRW-SP2]
MSIVLSYYDEATVPGYMDRLFVNIASRLMAKGYTFKLASKSPNSFVGTITNHTRAMTVVQVSCVDNIIHWRRIL